MRPRVISLFAILLMGCTDTSTTEERSMPEDGAAVEGAGNGRADAVDKAVEAGTGDTAELD